MRREICCIVHWLAGFWAGERLATNSVPGRSSRKPLGSLIFSLLELCRTGLLLMLDSSLDWGDLWSLLRPLSFPIRCYVRGLTWVRTLDSALAPLPKASCRFSASPVTSCASGLHSVSTRPTRLQPEGTRHRLGPVRPAGYTVPSLPAFQTVPADPTLPSW